MAKAVDISALEQLARPVLAGLGYELVELEWKHEGGHWLLRVLIDHSLASDPSHPGQPGPAESAPEPSPPAGSAQPPPVTLEDCARVSRSLGAELDVADAIHLPFHLEVSSPGINRPLKREEDFRRFAGQKAKVRTRTPLLDPVSPAGRRNFAGRLVRAAEGRVTIEVDGRLYDIPLAEVEKANLVYEF